VLGDLGERLPGRVVASCFGHQVVGHSSRCSAGDTPAVKVGHDGGAVNAKLHGEHLDGRAGLVPGDQVIDLGVGEAPLDRV
jgi:hypothetical protein